MSNIVYTGKTRLHLSNALWNLGSMYENARVALWEAVANEIDAMQDIPKPTIWIDVYKDKIVITGNGSGMLPVMPEGDEKLLNYFFEQGGQEVDDVRDSLSPVAKHSLVWLLNYVSYSPKKQMAGEQQNGVRGIGALAYLTYAKVAEVVTKPSEKLVKALLKEGIAMPKGNSFAITMPQIEVYKESKIEPSVVALQEPLRDPFGNVLTSGTRVTITGFNDEGITYRANGQLTPGRIHGYLKTKVADDVSVWVGDHVRYTQTQKVWTKVTKDVVKGTLVFDGFGTCDDGTPFPIKLYFDALKEPNSPIVLRGQRPIFRLTEIEEMNHFPWNALGGEIAFPQYMIDAHLWNPQKDMLRESTEKQKWIAALLEIEQTIAKEFKKQRDLYINKSNQEFVDDFRQATMTALSSIDVFAGHRNAGMVKKGDTKAIDTDDDEQEEKKIRPGIRAKVLSENGGGLFNIKVELLDSWNRQIAQQTTSVTGKITFGNYKNGSYVLRVLAEPNLVRGNREYRFKISNDQPGYTGIFKLAVDSGREIRPRMKAKMLEFEWVTLPEHVPYQVYIERGLLLFNIAHQALNRALMDVDEIMQLMILSRYTSDAHAMLLSGIEKDQLMIIAAELNAKLFPIFRQKREARKSLLKGRKMRKNRK